MNSFPPDEVAHWGNVLRGTYCLFTNQEELFCFKSCIYILLSGNTPQKVYLWLASFTLSNCLLTLSSVHINFCRWDQQWCWCSLNSFFLFSSPHKSLPSFWDDLSPWQPQDTLDWVSVGKSFFSSWCPWILMATKTWMSFHMTWRSLKGHWSGLVCSVCFVWLSSMQCPPWHVCSPTYIFATMFGASGRCLGPDFRISIWGVWLIAQKHRWPWGFVFLPATLCPPCIYCFTLTSAYHC